ncbi:MAG: High-affinity branched-chain amino acid transport system permease protein LivH [Candidatus Ordinivivax streblomastigis]|uniref:High-affinity branched-chain amino acid transport system permease protein LivH n=1 Tax=Candidatus Ordinivivax streblomastigis TaxID=2540710 RepID=A0A5M8NZ55_9BACT|nr:MAG: High-affinity branched-chain amino acid transport system permease protein LivH [Candidatus Ordinivivax streblomastigis]
MFKRQLKSILKSRDNFMDFLNLCSIIILSLFGNYIISILQDDIRIVHIIRIVTLFVLSVLCYFVVANFKFYNNEAVKEWEKATQGYKQTNSIDNMFMEAITKNKSWFIRRIIICVLCLLIFFFAGKIPYQMLFEHSFYIFIKAFILLLCAIGFFHIYRVTSFFHIAHAITLTVSAYFTYLFSMQLQYPVWLSIPFAISCATGIGMISEIALYKPLRKRNASPMILMISSLGLYTLLQNVISILWGDDTKSIRTGEIKVGNEFLGAYITDIQIITIVVCLVLFLACAFFMKYNRIGRNICAVASNPDLSNIVGINSNRIILWSFGIGSVLAAVAGILIAFDTDMTPTMGFNWLLYGVVAMIIGGVGSNWGLVGGALLLATAQHLAAYYIGSQWMDAVAYIILILFLIGKPLGFSGKRLKKIEI